MPSRKPIKRIAEMMKTALQLLLPSTANKQLPEDVARIAVYDKYVVS
jgi:hypothetical protein